MKKNYFFTAFMAVASLFLMQLPVYAQEETQNAGGFTLADAGRFFGYFFLVMGAIYLALLFTNWLGKQQRKHKK